MVYRYAIWSDRESGECTWIRDDAGAFVRFRDYAVMEAERDALAAQVPKWQPIETAPKDTIAKLLGYRNELGNWRTVRGRYYSQEEIDDYWEYPEEAVPGWYETPANADEPPNVWFVVATHWMPMPPAPKEKQ